MILIIIFDSLVVRFFWVIFLFDFVCEVIKSVGIYLGIVIFGCCFVYGGIDLGELYWMIIKGGGVNGVSYFSL